MNVPNVKLCEFHHEEAAEFISIIESVTRELCRTYVGRSKDAIILIDSRLVIADVVTIFRLFALLSVRRGVDTWSLAL